MTTYNSQAKGSLEMDGGIKEYSVKRGLNTVSFLVAIYATVLAIALSIVGFLPLCGCVKLLITIILVPSLYYFILSTKTGRKLLSKELSRLLNFEERYGSK